MGRLRKAGIGIALIAVLLGYTVHHPVPAEIPDPMYFQLLIDVLAASEVASRVSEYLGFNRWWSYPGNIDVPLPHPHLKDFDVDYVQFAGVDSVVITPEEFKESSRPGGALVFYHGGGWVFGSTLTYLTLLKQAAKETGMMVMAPDYRRAPKYPFPIPFEDCLNSTIAFLSKTDEFKFDPKKVTLIGDSAGGNLAMAINLELLKRSKTDPSIRLPSMLTMIYPIVQMGNFRLPSYQQNEAFIFRRNLIPKFWLAYIGLNERLDLADIIANNNHINRNDAELMRKLDIVSSKAIPDKFKVRGFNSSVLPLTVKQRDQLDDKVVDVMKRSLLDPRIAPFMAGDEELMGLPRTHILVCEYDSIRDDGVLLYERLKRLKRAVTFQYLPDALHASASVGATFPDTYYGKQNIILFQYIKSHNSEVEGGFA